MTGAWNKFEAEKLPVFGVAGLAGVTNEGLQLLGTVTGVVVAGAEEGVVLAVSRVVAVDATHKATAKGGADGQKRIDYAFFAANISADLLEVHAHVWRKLRILGLEVVLGGRECLDDVAALAPDVDVVYCACRPVGVWTFADEERVRAVLESATGLGGVDGELQASGAHSDVDLRVLLDGREDASSRVIIHAAVGGVRIAVSGTHVVAQAEDETMAVDGDLIVLRGHGVVIDGVAVGPQ